MVVMRKNRNGTRLYRVIVGAAAAGMIAGAAGAQDKPPSFFEMSEYRYRYPETDTNVDLYIRNWQASHHAVRHGGWLERDILLPGDPLKPSAPGTVLSSAELFTCGMLDPGCVTNPMSDAHQQLFLYIVRGAGTVTAGGETVPLRPGSWVFIPAGIEYRFENTGDEYLESVILAERVPDGFRADARIHSGQYRGAIPDTGWQWAFDRYLLATDAPFAVPTEIGIACIPAFDVSHPYICRAGTEEVWYQINGESLLIIGNRLRVQRPGDACLIPPNGRVPRGSINMTGEPQVWLYYRRGEEPKAQSAASVGDGSGPVPSFEADSPYSSRVPGRGPDLDLYHRSWKDSPVVIGHGGFRIQAILEPGDPLDPPRKGAVLGCLTEYAHGFLPAGETTRLQTQPRHQTVFVVLGGNGTVTGGTVSADLAKGSGAFIPAGLSYRFTAGTAPLEVLIISEQVTRDFVPAKEMQTGSYHDSVPGAGPFMHWAHIPRGMLSPTWQNPIGFGFITIDGGEIAHPHTAPIGIEEIWLMLEGRGLMFLGNRLFRHDPGEAFYIPPTHKVPHSSINPTDTPMLWMYLGIRLDQQKPVTPPVQALIDSLTLEK